MSGSSSLTIRAKLVCPSAIAYGDRGNPPKIPGGAVLTFEVELLEILPAAPAQANGAPMPGSLRLPIPHGAGPGAPAALKPGLVGAPH